MSPAERVKRIRDAAARARSAVACVRAMLAATERVLAALERMLAEEIPNVVTLREALDAEVHARRAANESVLVMVEAADRAQDMLGAGTRLVVPKR